jgi:acyl-CoA reductase-like NAD-dependent aldehyde dehydrogenase
MTKVLLSCHCKNMISSQKFQKMNPWSEDDILDEVVFQSPMDVVRGLGQFKNHLVSFPKWSVQQKHELLTRITQQIKQQQQEIVRLESLHQGLPHQFIQEHVYEWVLSYLETFIEELSHSPNLNFRPVGLIALLPDWQLGFRQIAERLIPALVSGNCVLIKSDPATRMSTLLWKGILNQAELSEEIVQFIDGDDELGLFIMKHPAFKSICYSGRTEKAESIWPVLPLFRKNYSMTLSTKNSLAILPEASDSQIQQSLSSCLMGYGALNHGMHRVFCIEKDVERVTEIISAELQKIDWNSSDPSSSKYGVRLNVQDPTLVQKLKSEGGRFVCDPNEDSRRPLVYLDLSNCSELQQDPASFVSVNAVKYTHEMAKWINNGYLGHSAMIIGPAEKAQQLGFKLEVEHVWINNWLESSDKRLLIHGRKLSYRGDNINKLQSKLWQY